MLKFQYLTLVVLTLREHCNFGPRFSRRQNQVRTPNLLVKIIIEFEHVYLLTREFVLMGSNEILIVSALIKAFWCGSLLKKEGVFFSLSLRDSY